MNRYVILYGFVMLLCISFFYRMSNLDAEYVSDFEDNRYAVLIDCGSTGSRMYIYYWKDDEKAYGLPRIRRMLDSSGRPFSAKVEPGLSSFENNPADATAYMIKLLILSYQYIPTRLRSSTSLYILATGGMRLIPPEKANKILKTLLDELPNTIQYRINRVKIITGSMEGSFMWISLNYIFHKFQKNCDKTHGIFEMGGASMQIAFEVDNSSDETVAFTYQCPNNRKSVTHYIYSITILGGGANYAYEHYSEKYRSHGPDEPCFPLNCTSKSGDVKKIGDGSLEVCYGRISATFDSFLPKKIQSTELSQLKLYLKRAGEVSNITFFGLGEAWYSFYDYLNYVGPLVPLYYWGLGKNYCSTQCADLHEKLNKGYFNSDNHKYMLTECFKLSYIRYILNKFFPLEQFKPVINIQKFEGEEIEWTYGAIIFYISQKHT